MATFAGWLFRHRHVQGPQSVCHLSRGLSRLRQCAHRRRQTGTRTGQAAYRRPTTAGTGSEVTGIAIFDLLSLTVKTGIAWPALRPTEGLVDPDCTASLPGGVVAAAGLDVLSHALESYTARPYVHRPAPPRPSLRPMSQGANPWSDLGCSEALRVLGRNLERAVRMPPTAKPASR